MDFCFLGSFMHTIDGQRRVAIPREWRSTNTTELSSFYLLPGRNQTIQVIPKKLFDIQVLEKVAEVSFANERDSMALARIGAKASLSTCDRQGRIRLSQVLFEYAGLEDQAMLIGGITSIQIMTPANWDKNEMDIDEILNQVEKIQKTGSL